jgi:hypothetical protein
MEHADIYFHEGSEPIRWTYQSGLRSAFAACPAPMPPKMEELLKQLSAKELVQYLRDDELSEGPLLAKYYAADFT